MMRLVVLPDGSVLLAPTETSLNQSAVEGIAAALREQDGKLRVFAEPLQIIDLRGESWRVGDVAQTTVREWEA